MSHILYKAIHFTVNPLQPYVEILIAELVEVDFESFVETEDGVTAYIRSQDFYETVLDDIQIINSDEANISYTTEDIEQVNWNEEWEKNFNPIVIEEICAVRAPFHDKFEVKYDIVIEPKMSFGTGHHETTHMMIQHLLKTDIRDKTVLDMGCGTGVLAILAEMRRAKTVDAIDIDNWCYINSLENVKRNECNRISVYEGDVKILIEKSYDIITANINRNILLSDISIYASHLNTKGQLFLSGFYVEDIAIIESECNANMLKLVDKIERNGWVSLKFLN